MKKSKRLNFKKVFALTLTFVFALVLFAGCANQSGQQTNKGSAANAITADNEILTYEPVDDSKTTLYVGTVGNLNIQKMMDGFAEANPDVQIINVDITGGNSVRSPYVDWMEKGFRPDVMFIASGLYSNIDPTLYFEELTTNDVIPLYQAESLNNMAVNGRLYSIPGPSVIYGMHYNKTLFDEYGWTYPSTMDEFIELCKQIKTDTNGEVQAWNPSAKYEMQFIPTLEGFQYSELFGGAENRTWYNELIEDKATFTEHLRPFFEMYQSLVDAGIITEDYFDYSATTRLKEFGESKIAMLNYSVSRQPVTDAAETSIGYYPSTTGDGYLLSELSYALAQPVKEHTDKEADAIQRMLAYCSTPEAQQMYIDNSVMVSNLKEDAATDDLPQIVQNALVNGHIFSALSFKRADQPANYKPLASIRAQMLSMIKGEQTIDGALAALDDERKSVENGTFKTELETIATASSDFTILETSEYFADMFREVTGADVALMPDNITYRGNVMRIFAGDITTAHVTTLVPRSLANKSTLVKTTMTGQQLIDTVSTPSYSEDGKLDCGVYAVSGLKCTVAPWHAVGERVMSVTLADGTEIEPAKTYTVAYWDGTVNPADVTQAVEAYEGTFAELLTAKLKADKTIAPANDGRITLEWDIK